ncbi:hypothetical protein RF657_17795 [Yersinia rochesterensis]|uniref:hypothetical protein n=1 Tax=Yersinia rochesterensis TaxID=1604335 RepID=UPI002852F5BC|nr:hypothetical protein [Yersinia rochesterensis]MDR5020224.1 hypothetical protein [Yersinia rochesterensis]
MFVTHKRFITTENELQNCRQLLASSTDSLAGIQVAAGSGSGIYKRILECREMAERVRRLMPSASCRDSLMLLDHLAYMDGWLTHLATTLPLDINAGLLEKTALAGNVAMIYLAQPST